MVSMGACCQVRPGFKSRQGRVYFSDKFENSYMTWIYGIVGIPTDIISDVGGMHTPDIFNRLSYEHRWGGSVEVAHKYRASTWLRYQWLENCLDDESWVGTPIRRSLVLIYWNIDHRWLSKKITSLGGPTLKKLNYNYNKLDKNRNGTFLYVQILFADLKLNIIIELVLKLCLHRPLQLSICLCFLFEKREKMQKEEKIPENAEKNILQAFRWAQHPKADQNTQQLSM